jgi:putative transposase
MVLNNVGLIVKNQWDEVPNRFPGVCLDEREFMPNHIHGIILIVGAQFIAPHKKIQLVGQTKTNKGAINRAPTLGEITRSFKAIPPADTFISHGKVWLATQLLRAHRPR